MERREFIAKSILAAAAVSVAPDMLNAKSESFLSSDPEGEELNPTITEDTVKDGVRYIVAVPCAKVCSKQIDLQIDTTDNTVLDCMFTRGCPGNTIGLCALLKGMSVAEAINRLDGTPCSKRGTSCPDQLARVLKML